MSLVAVAKLNACHGDHVVAVAHDHRPVGHLVQDLCILPGKRGHLPDRGIFFKDNAALRVCKDFKRIAFADAQRAADFFRDDDASKVVPLCQVGAKKFFKFFKKPTKTGG